MSEGPSCGSFELVSKIKGHEGPDILGPRGRFVSVRHGRNLHVVDTRPKRPKPTGLVFKEATSTTRLTALHPTAKRVAVRSQLEHWLELRSADGVEVHFDASTLAYLGRAELPKIRGRVKQARAWGVDLVAVETASQVHVFRRRD